MPQTSNYTPLTLEILNKVSVHTGRGSRHRQSQKSAESLNPKAHVPEARKIGLLAATDIESLLQPLPLPRNRSTGEDFKFRLELARV